MVAVCLRGREKCLRNILGATYQLPSGHVGLSVPVVPGTSVLFSQAFPAISRSIQKIVQRLRKGMGWRSGGEGKRLKGEGMLKSTIYRKMK